MNINISAESTLRFVKPIRKNEWKLHFGKIPAGPKSSESTCLFFVSGKIINFAAVFHFGKPLFSPKPQAPQPESTNQPINQSTKN